MSKIPSQLRHCPDALPLPSLFPEQRHRQPRIAVHPAARAVAQPRAVLGRAGRRGWGDAAGRDAGAGRPAAGRAVRGVPKVPAAEVWRERQR